MNAMTELAAAEAARTKRVQAEALKRGLLLLTCGIYGNVARFLFPLTIQDSVFAEALGILDAALNALLDTKNNMVSA